jgi:uncharacterized protein YprB with RNaseH-like and TPR domain
VVVAVPLHPSFRSRLREAIGQQKAAARRAEGPRELVYEPVEDAQDRSDTEQALWIADTLGGSWQRENVGAGTCLVVERCYPAAWNHGNGDVGSYAEALARHRRALSRFGPAAGNDGMLFDEPDSSLLFFDLETTGLSGGAGTCAFLVGYGWFDAEAFRTRQYFLAGYGHEPAMLRMAGRHVVEFDRTGMARPGVFDAPPGIDADSGARCSLVTFNGRTFDVPLIENRYLFHRLASPFDRMRHLDLLHPARRLWRYRPSAPRRAEGGPFAQHLRTSALRDEFRRARRLDLSASAAGCALQELEDAVLGFRRSGDVPGAEIPARYFHYVRTGDVRPLQPVLEHNRLDLLSLAGLTSVVARMIEQGPDAARNTHECLALGRFYERAGSSERATVCYEMAAACSRTAAPVEDAAVQREALRHLALRYRREGRHAEAAAAWQQLLDCAGATDAGTLDACALEALQALAVHNEHRSRDFEAARSLVLRALPAARCPREQESLRHRLARLDRKLDEWGRG